MKNKFRISIFAATALFTFTFAVFAQPNKPRDGSRDFDFEIGVWKTKLRRLVKPLTGSTTWMEYEGKTTVSKVWNGKANLVELDVTSASGRIEALSLRLYDPASRQWSLNFSNSASGTMAIPSIGEFKNGRGEFYNTETLYGRSIYVRFVITPTGPDTCHFEQAFSDDGGKTWEVNWIADDTRVKERASPADASAEKDRNRDFDFNFGKWKTHISRLEKPLTGSTKWVEYNGLSKVGKIWNGRASIFELDVTGPGGRIEGLGIRLYNPDSRQWSLNWANSSDGVLTTPMIGEFKEGRGTFFDQELFNGKAIFVRNGFSEIKPDSSRFEQAFSMDGGKTWETNWIMTFTRPDK